MKINIGTSIFLRNIQLSIQTVDTTNLTPYLNGILITAKDDSLTLLSSNLNYQSKIVIKDNVEIKEEGEILIKGTLLFNLLSKIHDDQLEITTVEDNVLNITTKNGDYNLNLIDNSSYPALDFNYDNALKLVIPTKFINEINNKITPFVVINPSDNNRILSGISFDTTHKENTLEVIGTDSFHLAYISKEIELPKLQFIVLPETLRFIINNNEHNEDICLFITKQKIFFLNQNNLFCCKLIEGHYPTLYKTIENEYKYSFNINNSDLTNVVDLASVMTGNDKRPVITLVISKDKIDIAAQNYESGNSSQSIQIKDNNYQNKITFILNIKFLQHILKSFGGKEITFNFNDENKPILISNHENKNEKYLVLPIRM